MILKSTFHAVNLNRATPAVVRLNPEKWSEDVPVSIAWDPSHLGDETFTVAVLLARFSMRDDNVYFHSMLSLQEEQRNTGESQFIVPKGEGRG